jgi:hypothetical protein
MNGKSSQQAEATPLLATGTAAEYGSWTDISDSSNDKANGPFSLRHLSSRLGDYIAQHTVRPLALVVSGVCVLSFVRRNKGFGSIK